MTEKNTNSNLEGAVEKHYWRAVACLLTLILIGTAFWGVRRFNPALFLGKPDFIAVPKQEQPELKQKKPTQNKQKPDNSNTATVQETKTSPSTETKQEQPKQKQKQKKSTQNKQKPDNNNTATVQETKTSPSTETKQETTKQKQKQSPKDKPAALNINTATVEELQKFLGIGPKTALRIVQYRKENGNFSSVDALMEVRGIGEKTLEKLKPFIGVD